MPSQEILKIRDVHKKRVAQILFFKIRPSQEILKIRDGTPLEAEELLTYIKSPRNGLVWHFSSKLDVPSNVLQKKIVAWILFFKIKPSQEIPKIRDGTRLEAEELLTYTKKPSKWIVKIVARILFFKIRPSQEILKIRDGTPLEAEEILTYIKELSKRSVWPSQEILKIRDGTPLEAEELLTYIKSPRNGLVWHFSSKLDVPSNVIQKKRVARILFFKIRTSQEILKIRDGTPLEAEEILTYIKMSSKRPSQEILKIRDVHKKRVAQILFFKIRPSQEILKIRDGTPLEAEELLTYIKSPRNGLVWHFSSKLDVPSNVLQKKIVAWILFFKIKPSQEIPKIRDGTRLEAEEILTYIKRPSKQINVPSNVVQKKIVAWILFFKIRPSQEIIKICDGTPLERPSQEILKIRDVAQILFFKIRPSQEILKIRDGTPLEAEELLTYIKSPRNGLVWHFSSKLDKIVAWILFFKIRPSQEIIKICDGTPLEMPSQEILKIRDVHKKRVAQILFFKIRPSQEILKIRDGTPLEAEELLTYIKSPRNGLVWHFSSKLDVPSNVLQKKIVAWILFFKIKPSQEIPKIRDGTRLEAEELLTYTKKPSKWIGLKKIVAQILFFKIRPSQEILKIRDGTPLEAEEILTYIKELSKRSVWPSQEILKIRDGTPLEAEELLTYIKSPRNGLVWHFSSKLDVPSNVIQKKRVARILFFKIRTSQEILKIRDGTPLEAEEILTYIKMSSKRIGLILFFKIRPSQEILKIRDGTPLEAEELLTYIKSPRNGLVWHFSSKLDVPSNVLQKKIVAWILFFKIKPSQEIPKIRDGTRLEAEELLTYTKELSKRSVWYFSSKLDVPSNMVQKKKSVHKKRVAQILFFKIRPSQEILKIRDGTPLEAEELLTYIKSPRNGLVWHFSSKLDVPSNVLQKKIVAWILFFKIKPSQEIPKIRDGTRLEAEELLTYTKELSKRSVWPSQEILKIRDGTPLEAEELLTYIKSPRNGLVWHFSSKLDVPSNVIQKKRVAHILFFKIRTSQEILKIRDGTPLEAEEILTYIKMSSKRPSQEILKIRDVAQILFFKIRPSQEILKIRDGTPLEAEELLTYIKSPRNGLVWHFSSKLDVPSNVLQKKIVAWILFFKIKPSQEIPKIRDGTRLEAEEILTYIKRPSKQISLMPSQEILKIRDVHKKRVAQILFFKIRPSQEILKIRDGTPLEAEELLTYIKSPRNGLVWHFSSKLDVPSNILQKKIVAWILFFKIKPSQEIPKIRDGTRLEAEELLTYTKKPSKWIGLKKIVARILFFKIRPSQEILKIRDGTPLEAEEILTYIKELSKRSVWPSQEILKIRDGTPLEAEELFTYIKSPRNGLVWHFSSKLDVPSNVIQKKRVARILFFKIRTSQEILKIRDGTPLEAEEILTYIKMPSQEILKIRDGTPLEAEEILTYIKMPSQEILKIRDGTPLEAEELLTYIKSPRNGLVWHFSSKPSQEIIKICDGTPLEMPSQEILKIRDVHKKRVAQIQFFKIRPSQEILKIRDGTPLEAEELLTYIKSPRNGLVWHFSSKLDVPSNVLQKKIVAWILFFKIKPSQEIPKIRDGTRLEAEELLTYTKSPRNGLVWHYSSKLDVPSNVVQKKRVARILFFKIRTSQEILKIRDGTPLEAE
ncbi:hypothetical protein OROHE_018171 [Orobanche hederae]